METQANLNFAKDNRPKRVRVTSLEAYNEIRDSLPERERTVMVVLRRYIYILRKAPTSYELLEFMRLDLNDPKLDVNFCRPRLTALKDRGLVKNGEKVVCSVTGKKAFTWEMSDQVRSVLK